LKVAQTRTTRYALNASIAANSRATRRSPTTALRPVRVLIRSNGADLTQFLKPYGCNALPEHASYLRTAPASLMDVSRETLDKIVSSQCASTTLCSSSNRDLRRQWISCECFNCLLERQSPRVGSPELRPLDPSLPLQGTSVAISAEPAPARFDHSGFAQNLTNIRAKSDSFKRHADNSEPTPTGFWAAHEFGASISSAAQRVLRLCKPAIIGFQVC